MDKVRVYVEFDNENDASNFLRDCSLWQHNNAYGLTDSGYLEEG